jgi:type II secretory ATPase GspE/PulE/Tfp pilus assembly ATPase PilB-like protein
METRGEEKIQQLATKTNQTVIENTNSLDEMPPATNPNTNPESLVLYRAVGCKQCGNSGFSGRIGIYEVLDVTPEISTLITTKATANEIQKSAMAKGMSTMQEDGLLKALQSMTTIEEVLRVTRE